MVYDDYADIGIFAKWVMDAPGIGERAHPLEGRRCPCTRKGIKLVLLTIIAISQPVFVWTFQIRKRLRISLPQFLEETFQSSEDLRRWQLPHLALADDFNRNSPGILAPDCIELTQ